MLASLKSPILTKMRQKVFKETCVVEEYFVTHTTGNWRLRVLLIRTRILSGVNFRRPLLLKMWCLTRRFPSLFSQIKEVFREFTKGPHLDKCKCNILKNSLDLQQILMYFLHYFKVTVLGLEGGCGCGSGGI